jgi:hypothetical protein
MDNSEYVRQIPKESELDKLRGPESGRNAGVFEDFGP